MHPRARIVLLSLLASIASCKRDSSPERQSAPSVVSAEAPKSPVPALLSALARAPEPPPAAPSLTADRKALSAEERLAAEAYRDALGRGRNATRKKEYAAAIAAFDEALKHKPDDARALAERGYAALSAKEYEKARADLLAAKRLASDLALLSQIVHNLGLVEEAVGDSALGKEQKELAQKLKRDARASANAKENCPLELERPNKQGELVLSWVALWKRLNSEHQQKFGRAFPFHGSAVVTDEDARHALTGALNDGKHAWVIDMEDSDNGTVLWSAVFALPDGKLLLFPSLAQRYIGRCRMGPWAAWLEDDPDMPRVVVESVNNELGYMCESGPNGFAPCNFDKPDQKPVQSYCDAGTYGMKSFFFDLKKQTIALVVEETGSQEGRADGASRVSLIVQPDGVLPSGLGCKDKLLFSPPSGP